MLDEERRVVFGHNPNYSGVKYHIEVKSNGFVLVKDGLEGSVRIFKDLEEIYTAMAREMNLLGVWEEIEVFYTEESTDRASAELIEDIDKTVKKIKKKNFKKTNHFIYPN